METERSESHQNKIYQGLPVTLDILLLARISADSVLPGDQKVSTRCSNFVVHHSRDMEIVDADKLLIYELCHHYLAFDTDGMISFPNLS